MEKTGIKAIRAGDPVVDDKGRKVGTLTSTVLVDSVQMGLAYVDRKLGKEGTVLSIALLPRKGEPTFSPSLPRETAIVLPRFAQFA